MFWPIKNRTAGKLQPVMAFTLPFHNGVLQEQLNAALATVKLFGIRSFWLECEWVKGIEGIVRR